MNIVDDFIIIKVNNNEINVDCILDFYKKMQFLAVLHSMLFQQQETLPVSSLLLFEHIHYSSDHISLFRKLNPSTG